MHPHYSLSPRCSDISPTLAYEILAVPARNTTDLSIFKITTVIFILFYSKLLWKLCCCFAWKIGLHAACYWAV